MLPAKRRQIAWTIFTNLKSLDSLFKQAFECKEKQDKELSKTEAEYIAACLNAKLGALDSNMQITAENIISDKPIPRRYGFMKSSIANLEPLEVANFMARLLIDLDDTNSLPGDVIDEIQSSEEYKKMISVGSIDIKFVNPYMYYMSALLLRKRGYVKSFNAFYRLPYIKGSRICYSTAVTKTDLIKKKLPDAPGVYFFLGAKKEILYIGKASSLRNRVRSYFASDIKEKRSELIEKMVTAAKTVEWTVADSVLEALILETNLIRTHKPRYNTLSKDDKSYNHLVITNEEWPRVLVVRGKDLTEKFTEKELKYHFGPFPSGSLFREALKIVRRLFKYYDTERPIGKERSKVVKGRIDFNRQIGLYPNATDKDEYTKNIRHIRLFFEGKKRQIIKELEREMMQLAQREEFEAADHIKRKIFALQHIQDIALIKADSKVYRDEDSVRIEAYDVAHLGGQDMVGVMTVVEAGEPKKSEYRKFKITSVDRSNDPGALKEMLNRRLYHPEWPFPQIIVVDGSTAQKNAAEFILRKHALAIPVVAVVKDDRHKPIRVIAAKKLREQYEQLVLLANAEAHRFSLAYHRELRGKRIRQN